MNNRRFNPMVATALVACGLVTAASRPAQAWKPKTHVYLAEQALKDALDDGKVTIYQTDYLGDKVVGTLGSFDVDPKILAALKAAPKQYRAGVLGPDAYPDIMTGQEIIHPEESDAIDGGSNGSNAWLTNMWERGFSGSDSLQVQAFTIGYLTHAAGDIFAHTFVNYFSGGEFMAAPDPRNAVKHLILEGYLGKRTPQTISAFTTHMRSGGIGDQRKRDDIAKNGGNGGDGDDPGSKATYSDVNLPITQEDTSIDGVQDFIYNEMVRVQPDSLLERSLYKGDGLHFSIPYVYSTLRNGLAKDVAEYDKTRLSKTGPDRLAYAATHGPAAEYKRAWIADIDDGLKAWPAVSYELSKALVYNEGGADMDRAKAVMGQYVRDHLASMSGVPDGVVATVAFINDVINTILPPPVREFFHEIEKAPLNFLIQCLTGKSPDEWADYLKNPDTHFTPVMTTPGGGHDGDVEHPVDLATFNHDYLKITDTGFGDPSQKWQIEQLPPAFNTVQMCKLLLLGETGMKQLAAALHAKGADCGPLPSPYRNVMLGWVRSLDHGNQWQGLPGRTGQPGPQPFLAANNGAAWRVLFMHQIGEKDWIRTNTHGASPVPQDPTPTPAPPPVPSDLQRWVGDWDTTMGRMTLTLGADGILRGTDERRIENGIGVGGDSVEIHMGTAPGNADGQWHTQARTGPYALDGVLHWVISDDNNSWTGTFYNPQNQAASTASWNGTRRVPAPTSTTPGTTGTPVPTTPTTTEYTGSNASQSLANFDVRLDSLKLARDGRIEAFLSLKNPGTQTQKLADTTLDLWLIDADGVGWYGIQSVWRASGDTRGEPVRFEVEPGSEVKARFAFRNPGGLRGLRTLRLQDHNVDNGPVAAFDLAGTLLTGADASGGTPIAGLQSVADGQFKQMDAWDMRLDGVRKRGGKLEAYFTVKNPNAAGSPKRYSAVSVTLTDTDGATGDAAYSLYRASGTGREKFEDTLFVAPNGEMHISYGLNLPTGVIPKRLTVAVNGGGKQTWDVSGVH